MLIFTVCCSKFDQIVEAGYKYAKEHLGEWTARSRRFVVAEDGKCAADFTNLAKAKPNSVESELETTEDQFRHVHGGSKALGTDGRFPG